MTLQTLATQLKIPVKKAEQTRIQKSQGIEHVLKPTYHFTTVITQEGNYFIAHNLEFGVVSQGASIEEATTNLKEALELYLEDVSPDELQTVKANRPMVTTMELEYA